MALSTAPVVVFFADWYRLVPESAAWRAPSTKSRQRGPGFMSEARRIASDEEWEALARVQTVCTLNDLQTHYTVDVGYLSQKDLCLSNDVDYFFNS